MLRSMFSGVSGLRSFQTMMDFIGNDIANVNTAGYKSSQVVFEDLLSQTLRGAGAPQGAGGVNPTQVGLGVKIAGGALNFAQGAAQLTGRATDLSISGDGFFMVNAANGEKLYTRLGSFGFDGQGKLVSPDGSVVQGWPAVQGVIDTNTSPSDLTLPLGQSLPPSATKKVPMSGNLPADMTAAPVGTVINSSVTTYDTQGVQIPLTLQFTKTAADTWSVQAKTGATNVGTAASISFDPTTGALAAASATSLSLTNAAFTTAGAPNSGPITVDLAKITEFGSQKTITVDSQDGYTMGTLQSFNIGPDGTITGVFTNGLNGRIGRIALANFTNPGGLEKVGNTTFRASVNSGLPSVGDAGTGGRGTLSGGTLEMSNVDLAQEFTSLIVAQRGFQANSRVITASDELLQDLVNLKR